MNNRDAWRLRSQRRRVAHDMGMVPIRLWARPNEVGIIGIIADANDQAIDEAVSKRYPEKSTEE
jgi:hypothetical protein